MSTTTSNYEFVKPELVDSPPDITVTNINWDILDEELKSHIEEIGVISNLVSNMDAKIARGTSTALAVTLEGVVAYRAGMKITVIADSNNEGEATTLKVNGLASLPVYKFNTTTVPIIKAGKPYTFILSTDLSHFFIEASAEGNATTANVLADKTFSNDDETCLTGTMINNGSIGTVSLINESSEYTIPEGYHNGLGKVKADITGLIASVIKTGTTVGGIIGTFTSDATAAARDVLLGKTAYINGSKVTGTIVSKGSSIITPGTENQTIAANQYLSGAQTISGDVNLVAGNIKSGVNIFGVAGSFGLKTQNITTSGTFTVPTGVKELYVFLCGGGGGGGTSSGTARGCGGGGGGKPLLTKIAVTPGQVIAVIVGSGGAAGTAGGSTSFGTITVPGGGNGQSLSSYGYVSKGGNGATGGGAGHYSNNNGGAGGDGNIGADGGNTSGNNGGIGIGLPCINPFTGLTCCGGGGGGGGEGSTSPGTGGDGGGGNGGANGANGSNATTYGAGGGGAGMAGSGTKTGGTGYQGIIVVGYYA